LSFSPIPIHALLLSHSLLLLWTPPLKVYCNISRILPAVITSVRDPLPHGLEYRFLRWVSCFFIRNMNPLTKCLDCSSLLTMTASIFCRKTILTNLYVLLPVCYRFSSRSDDHLSCSSLSHSFLPPLLPKIICRCRSRPITLIRSRTSTRMLPPQSGARNPSRSRR
jgi:hypothetical protein